MKKMILALAMLACISLFAADQAAPAPQKTAAPAAKQTVAPAASAPAQAAPQKKEEPGIAFCLARGLCNISTGVLEIPRCVIYDNSMIPVFGLIIGIPEGAFFTVGRIFTGLFDILSFGTSGSTCHGEIFPNTVFQAKWICHKK